MKKTQIGDILFMRKKMFCLVLLVLFCLPSCIATRLSSSDTSPAKTPSNVSPAKVAKVDKSSAIKTVAVVSFAVNNYGAMYGQGVIDPALIEKSMDKMLSGTEKILKRRWKVKAAKSFVRKKSYFSLSIGETRKGLLAPVFAGRSMPTFTSDRKNVIKGNIDPQIAKKLCKVLSVDAIVLYYSEWTLDSGKFVPTVKALTKNCVSMYDSKGNKLFFKRKDVRGSKTIGSAYSRVHIDEGTITNWVEASLNGVEIIFSKVEI